MQQIIFYEIPNSLFLKTTCQIIQKCYENNVRTLITTLDPDMEANIDKSLWTYSQKAFVPHGSSKDPFPERQPIYITHGDENPNDAKALMMINKITDFQNFDKVMVLYDATSSTINQIKSKIAELKILNTAFNIYKLDPKTNGWLTI